MLKTIQLLMVVLLVIMVPHVSQGEIILSYTGQQFTEFEPESGSAFDTTDRITGTVTFDAVGDAEASSFALSTTVGGSTGFEFAVVDVTDPPLGMTINSNEFTWEGSLPDTWDLAVFGDIYGQDGEEQIAIHDQFADQAYINLLEANSSVGSTGFGAENQGSWTVVPEPSSLACTAVMFAFVLLGVWRKRRLHS